MEEAQAPRQGIAEEAEDIAIATKDPESLEAGSLFLDLRPFMDLSAPSVRFAILQHRLRALPVCGASPCEDAALWSLEDSAYSVQLSSCIWALQDPNIYSVRTALGRLVAEVDDD